MTSFGRSAVGLLPRSWGSRMNRWYRTGVLYVNARGCLILQEHESTATGILYTRDPCIPIMGTVPCTDMYGICAAAGFNVFSRRRVLRIAYKRRIPVAVVIALFLLVPVQTMRAHPHLLVDYRFEPAANDFGTMDGLYVYWTFDHLFSREVIHQIDRDRNGVLDETEIEAVYDYAFIHTSNYGYFTRYRIGSGTLQRPDEVRDFTAWIERDGRLTYRFLLPISELAAIGSGGRMNMTIWVYDETYFTAFELSEPIMKSAAAPPGITIRSSSVRDTDSAIYYDRMDTGITSAVTYPDRIDINVERSQ